MRANSQYRDELDVHIMFFPRVDLQSSTTVAPISGYDEYRAICNITDVLYECSASMFYHL